RHGAALPRAEGHGAHVQRGVSTPLAGHAQLKTCPAVPPAPIKTMYAPFWPGGKSGVALLGAPSEPAATWSSESLALQSTWSISVAGNVQGSMTWSPQITPPVGGTESRA